MDETINPFRPASAKQPVNPRLIGAEDAARIAMCSDDTAETPASDAPRPPFLPIGLLRIDWAILSVVAVCGVLAWLTS